MCRLAMASVLALVLLRSATAQSKRTDLRIDLSKIGFVVNGKQTCEDKGRLQDFPSRMMDQIIAAGPRSIPVIIGMITDQRSLKTTEPIICYWYGMAVGDIAFCLLSDLFTSSTGEKTMLGTGWNDMLGPNDDRRPASDQFNLFVKQHGRRTLQAKWRRLWDKHKDQVYWDAKERCFKLKESK